MENVGAVFMDVDALDIFAIDISTQLCALVDDEALFARFVGAVCKSCPEKAGTYDEVVEMSHAIMPCPKIFYDKVS